jgi:hypothetical protein
MRSHAGVAAKTFGILASEGINILGISTSEIKISCIIAAKYTELAVRALHSGFGLDKAPEARGAGAPTKEGVSPQGLRLFYWATEPPAVR